MNTLIFYLLIRIMESKDILDKLKKIRASKGVSQAEIASKLGVEQSMYSKLENGKQQMSLDRLFEIMNILNINIADLVVLDYSKNEDMLKDIQEVRAKLDDIEKNLL